jgi:hypothetical protein
VEFLLLLLNHSSENIPSKIPRIEYG